MADAISATNGSIGYVDQATATAKNFGIASLDGVPPNNESVGNEIAATTKDYTNGNVILRPDYTIRAKNSYPFVSWAYEVVCATGSDQAKGPLLRTSPTPRKARRCTPSPRSNSARVSNL